MAKIRTIKVLLAGGGTGGHIYPLLAVAKELGNLTSANGLGVDIRYFGDPLNYRDDLEGAGIHITKIATSKWRNYFDIQNIFDIFRFAWSLPQALVKIFFFMPDVCFTKGGPGALAIIYACKFYFIPIVVHESDTVPGRTNLKAAKKAKVIDLAFSEALSHFGKIIGTPHVVGNPVRSEILAVRDKTKESQRSYKIELGFDADAPLLFISGGSQGAERLNTFVLEHFKELVLKFQILHQTGPRNFQSYDREFRFLEKGIEENLMQRYKYVPYLDPTKIAKAYAASDFLIARAGSGTIFEAAATGTPTLLVPLPESAKNHQFQNAYVYREKGAALLLEEDNFLVTVVINELEKILNNPDKLKAMQDAARGFFVEKSANLIATDVLRVAQGIPVKNLDNSA